MRWIKKRPRSSHLAKGFGFGIATVVFIGLCFFPVMSDLAARPSAGMLRTVATIGGAFIIAWAIQTALLIQSSYFRDSLQETIIGSFIGIAASGLLGLILALALSERAEASHWIWADQLAFSLVVSAFIFLGICVVLLVYFAYEWARLGRIDPPE